MGQQYGQKKLRPSRRRRKRDRKAHKDPPSQNDNGRRRKPGLARTGTAQSGVLTREKNQVVSFVSPADKRDEWGKKTWKANCGRIIENVKIDWPGPYKKERGCYK